MAKVIHLAIVFLALAAEGLTAERERTLAPVLMTDFGERSQGNTSVTVRPSDKTVVVRVRWDEGQEGRSEISKTVSPENWAAHEGWFVYLDGEAVWAYDGADSLLLFLEKRRSGKNPPEGGITFVEGASSTAPVKLSVPVPEAVRSRVKEPLRKRLMK